MNKSKMKERIDGISSKEEFNDIKETLKKYPSICDRVSTLNLNYGTTTITRSEPINFGNNTKKVKDVLYKIVDDYKLIDDVFIYIKRYLKYIPNIIVKKYLPK